MVIYIAGPFTMREDIRDVRAIAERAGFTVRARWLDFPANVSVSDEVCRNEAFADLDDIENSDGLLVLSNYKLGAYKPSGMHFETGYAYALGLPIVVVGKGTNVFYHLPKIDVVPTLAEAFERLKERHDGQ